MMNIQDSHNRTRALAPDASFLVQAPAGSGKTELLTQRFLSLLAHSAQQPEEIIAITFTRKAAAEMRERLVRALQKARTEPEPSVAHEKTTWKLAQAVLKKDQVEGWKLFSNPNRLRFYTIDALCATINAQIPVLSGLGAGAPIVENAQPYYEHAAQEFILTLKTNPPWSDALKKVLLHCDNRTNLLVKLLCHILARREQWLPHVLQHHDLNDHVRKALEQGLQNIQLSALEHARAVLPTDCIPELLELCGSVGEYLSTEDANNPLCNLLELTTLDELTCERFTQWRSLATLFLSTKGEWRKSVTKRQGFPAKSESKTRFITLLNSIRENENLRRAFNDIIQAPPAHYNDSQWEILGALTELLPVLCAQLRLTFETHAVIDFIELNLAAHQALGETDNPTDLALHLDYQIKHLLVDEFQDTSVMQFNLLEKLVAGWEPGDGRTLFLVGDPMQSIYRFRNAEVGLFLRAQAVGVGSIPLEYLALTMNFRSSASIVNWINETFDTVFPKSPDITAGAIPLSRAIAANTDTNTAIHYHAYVANSPEQEAEAISKKIATYLATRTDSTIAILVRSRSHLQHIVPALHEASIPFQAVDIDPLATRPEIKDIHALTRALLHPADSVAWFSVLRAPWCGLSLQDLLALQEAMGDKLVSDTLKSIDSITLSTDGKARLERTGAVLLNAIHAYGRMTLPHLVYGTWLALGGPATLSHTQALSNIQAYRDLLAKLCSENNTLSTDTLSQEILRLFAKPPVETQARVQIMTIHKSKGLEFDHVFLPGLHRKTPPNQSQLLHWLERPSEHGGSDLILAPIKSATSKEDTIYQYCKRIEKHKLNYESARLLYVACTRAKQTLDLFGGISLDDKDCIQPPLASTFLGLLWPCHETAFSHTPIETTAPLEENTNAHTMLTRLTKDWRFPFDIKYAPTQIDTDQRQLWNEKRSYNAPRVQAQITGTVFHECIATIAGKMELTPIPTLLEHAKQRLEELGIPTHDIHPALTIIESALTNILADDRGQWILKAHHEQHNEYPITAMINHAPQHLVLDRTFVDESGTRWIIDYKTASPLEETMAEFVDAQKAEYLTQLTQYANALHTLDPRPIKCALYFPLCSAWIEWEHSSDPISKLTA